MFGSFTEPFNYVMCLGLTVLHATEIHVIIVTLYITLNVLYYIHYLHYTCLMLQLYSRILHTFSVVYLLLDEILQTPKFNLAKQTDCTNHTMN